MAEDGSTETKHLHPLPQPLEALSNGLGTVINSKGLDGDPIGGILLCALYSGDYATWHFNRERGATGAGHYFQHLKQASKDFKART